MSTRSGRLRASAIEASPPRTRKGISPQRSPARTRKTSPVPKSFPVRKSSPGTRSVRKSPSRKSPSRKSATKYPARKSPSRTTTTKESNENAKLKSPVKRPASKTKVSVKLEDLHKKIDIFKNTRSKTNEYSIKDVTSTTDEFTPIDKVNGLNSKDVYGLRNRRSVEELPPLRSSRLKEFIDSVPDIRRSLSKSLSKSISKSVSQSIDTYSDEENSADELIRERSQPATRKLATPIRGSENLLVTGGSKFEFGGRIGSALFIVLIPLTVYAILLSCDETFSAKSLLNFTVYKSLATWFSIPILIFITGQYALQALFVIFPILGPKADRMDETGTKFCFNAFFASIFTLSLIIVLNFYETLDKAIILNNYIQTSIISYIYGVILSIILYMKSRKLDSSELNFYGNTGYGLYDFFMGRELHPYIKKLDVKIWISRISNITTLLLTVLIFREGLHFTTSEIDKLMLNDPRELLYKIQYKETTIIFSAMQLSYILNFIFKEHKVTTTFFWQSEGVGYLQCVSSALYPFYFTAISKYVADTQLALSTNILIAACVLYTLGFLLMLTSNNIKHEFRTNPLHPSMTNLDSMPTFHGKKLLVSNVWGMLRHPNYAGDILIHVALAFPGILSQHYMAAAPAIITIFVLLHRAWRDHARCNRRYGAAWNRYCKRVPSVVIPKVL